MTENVVVGKSFAFAKRIIFFSQSLKLAKHFVLADQILRSGTSIGANIREAMRGQSKRDFLAKMNIALKEANETEYWLELIGATELAGDDVEIILGECRELCRILSSIVRTSKESIEQGK